MEKVERERGEGVGTGIGMLNEKRLLFKKKNNILKKNRALSGIVGRI